MSNWVDPEWLPRIPANDRGPFHCYILWSDTRQYYVGHTNDPESRIKKHFSDGVPTTSRHRLKLLWVSDGVRARTQARRFEAALKSYVKQRDEENFRRCTGLYFAKGATLLESSH